MRRRLLLPAMLVLVIAGCSEKQIEPEPWEFAGLKNGRRAGDLMFGGQPTREALRQLAADGLRTVVTTRGAGELEWDEAAVVDSLGLAFVAIRMPYPLTSITDAQVSRLDSVLTHAERPLLLHCSSGNRVSGLWAIWLAEHGGLPAEEAARLGRQAGMTRVAPLVEQRMGLQPSEP